MISAIYKRQDEIKRALKRGKHHKMLSSQEKFVEPEEPEEKKTGVLFICNCVEIEDVDKWSWPYCPKAERWLDLAFKFSQRPFDFERDCQVFHELELMVDEDFKKGIDYIKIRQDVNWTVPNDPFFQEGGFGYESVVTVLATFTLYDKSCGYVQGMNFLVAALVYHSSPEIAFWLLTTLFEDF